MELFQSLPVILVPNQNFSNRTDVTPETCGQISPQKLRSSCKNEKGENRVFYCFSSVASLIIEIKICRISFS